MRLKSFSFRLFLLILVFLSVVLGFIFFAVNQSNYQISYNNSIQKLEVSAEVFKALIQERTKVLIQQGQLLSLDFGFKSAYGTHDTGTLLSAMKNHLARIDNAEFMLLMEEDASIIASTLPESVGQWDQLVEEAENSEFGEASRIMVLDDRVFQVIIMPFLAPDFEAWMLFGFPITAEFLRELEAITQTDISVVSADGKQWHAKGVSGPPADELRSLLAPGSATVSSGPEGEDYLVQPVLLSEQSSIYALLGSSMRQSIQVHEQLKRRLVIILLGSLAIAAVLGPVLAHRISQPLRVLLNTVRSVLAGHYDTKVELNRSDEFGELSTAFNHMSRKIQSLENIQNSVSHVIAPDLSCLLQRHHGEPLEPSKVVVLASTLFDPKQAHKEPAVTAKQVADLVDRHGGAYADNHGARVAVFSDASSMGQNVANAIDLINAVSTKGGNEHVADACPAISLCAGDAIVERQHDPAWSIRGHLVQMAHQLLLLNAYYGARSIADTRLLIYAPELIFRELDTVDLAGEGETLTLIEPICFGADANTVELEEIERYHQALARYKADDYDLAVAGFEALLDASPGDKIYALYLHRAQRRAGMVDS